MSSQPNLPQDRSASLPPAVRETAAQLERLGFGAWLTGESWMQTLLGRRPTAFELSTSASIDQCLDQFEHAVPTAPDRGILTLPTGDVPLDLRVLPAGSDVRADLARRDFTVLGMAYRLTEEELVDPHEGLSDLQQGRLRWVGEASAAIQADPARMLRAARLVGEYGLEAAEVEEAVARNAGLERHVSAGRARGELARTLLSDHAAEGLGLLRRTGIERRLARSVRADSAGLVASLPRRLPLRLAGWLRGTRPRSLLRRLRFGLVRSRHVERLLELHPLDERVDASRDRAVSRLMRLLEDDDIAGLVQMREWEIQHGDAALDEADVRKKLTAVQQGIERIRRNREREDRRTRLAIDGQAVMEWLGCGPGRRVGAALRFASELVARDPDLNHEAALREALLEWDRENPERGS